MWPFPTQAPRHCLRALSLTLALGLFGPSQALAYPTGVVYAPSGYVADAGALSLYTYTAFYRDGLNYWSGLQLGLLAPWAPWGEEAPSFGGMEAGIDLIAGLGSVPLYKAILNVKLGLLAEAGWWPAIGIGFADFAPTSLANSLNAAYCSMSRSLSVGERELGTLTLGGMMTFPGDPTAFTPTPPLPNPYALLMGFASPKIGPFALGIDHVGGNSELSSTNLVLNVELRPGAGASIGYAFGHDRSARSPDAVFTQIYADFNGSDWIKSLSPATGERERP